MKVRLLETNEKKITTAEELEIQSQILERLYFPTDFYKFEIQIEDLEKVFFESGIECNKLFKGFGLVAFYRYGNYQLANFDDNIAIKISYNLDLGL